MKNLPGNMAAMRANTKEIEVLSRISAMKAKGTTPEAAFADAQRSGGEHKFFIAEIYAGYQEELRRSNSLDFDDLLVYGVSLFKAAPKILDNIRHILVDEL
jgi:DNA helicase-2/ATP-dependent DNA helicase PcrA